MSEENLLGKRGEFTSNPTCSICNKPDSVENLMCCFNCGQPAHRDCCKVTTDQWTCSQCTGELAGKPSSSRSSRSSGSRQKDRQLKRLEEEKILRLKEIAVEREYLERKYKLLEQDSDSDDQEDGRSKCSSKSHRSYVDDWVHKVQNADSAKQPPKLPPRSTLNPKAPVFPQTAPSATDPMSFLGNREDRQHQMPAPQNPFELGPRLNSKQSYLQSLHHQQQVNFPERSEELPSLTKSQINARKIGFKLSDFTGKPKEWPQFISSFEDSTLLCGLQDFENIARLRQCLKGIALDAVWPQLTLTGNVKAIIEELRAMFGRPELIIKDLIEEVEAIKPFREDNLLSIMTLAMAVQNLVAVITSCKLAAHFNNPNLLENLVGKLPANLKLQWGDRMLLLGSANLTDFNNWIQEKSHSARMVTNEVPKNPSISENKTEKKKSGSRLFLNVHTAPTDDVHYCSCCGSTCSSLEQCIKFKGFSLNEKWDVVNSNQLCRTCLNPRHKKLCPQIKECGTDGCTFKHNPLLHNKVQHDKKDVNRRFNLSSNVKDENQDKSDVTKKDESLLPKPSPNVNNAQHDNMVATQILGGDQQSVLFKIVPVKLHGPHKSIETFAFLDDGSGLTLIDQEICDQLDIVGVKQPLCLTWTSNTSRLEKNSQVVSVGISSLSGSNIYQVSGVRTVEELALPEQTLTPEYIKQFQHLLNLPIATYTSAKPRLLIGLKNSDLGAPIKTYEGKSNGPLCFQTRLGYVVFGSSHTHDTAGSSVVNVHTCECEIDLHNLVNSFFSLESVGVVASEKSLIPSDEKRAIDILTSSTKRVDGRFQSGLLWRFDTIRFPDNLTMARKRLQCLKRKLNNDPSLYKVMQSQISDYLDKGYIRQLSDIESNHRTERTWYLPIFPVSNPNKPDKVRIVWDAAAKHNNVSLNSMLLKGPDQLSSLVGVLQRFRQNKYAVCGDIMQMFHQVKIVEADQDSQRFLWLDESGKEVTYVMQVMTFGACCSPSCAQFVKNLNATDYLATHPRAVEGIIKNHYVDDFLDSLPSEEDLLRLALDVRTIHQHGGFKIRNWISNSSLVLEGLGENISNDDKSLSISEDKSVEKVLGLWWSTKEDIFTYNLKINDQNRDLLSGLIIPTKRQLLSTMMRTFDPLGFLSNAMIYVKIILQEVWKSGVEWDEKIQMDQFTKWRDWLQVMAKVGDLAIPRWHFKTENPTNLELHVFVDGSLQAYSAVAYIFSGQNSNRHGSLVGAKCKIASMKLTSVPRIELMGALIGARYAKAIEEEHTLTFQRRIFWCDSLTVLKWINNDRLKFKQFVGFRVGEILELSIPSEWRYVPSKLNVADQATKGSKLPVLSNDSEWFIGPDFLKQSEESWPVNIIHEAEDQDPTIEMREVFAHVGHIVPFIIDITRFSCWKRLYRVTAWIVRACAKWKVFKKSSEKSSPSLTTEEIRKGENFLYRQCQYNAFTDEVLILTKVKSGDVSLKLEKSSPIYKESPYLDDNGVVRRKGRIDAATAAFDVKRPIILPRKHYLTDLIIQSYHEDYKHQNDETVINELLQKYVIPSVRVQLKIVKGKCQKCKNDNAVPQPPLMAELPSCRLQSFTRPFSYVGVDYFGPILITVARRPEKRWVMLLTCLTIRAIHLEVAGSLTTDSCIMCVNRFIARRGAPIEILSDNGSNFKGASNELKAFLEDEDNQKTLADRFTSNTMNWKFITPGAPHMGGCWERLVRSVKTTLDQMNLISNPKEELLHTMLLEVEAVVNSRPLTHVGVENSSQEALTPFHFLLGSSSGAKPIGNGPEFYEEATVLRKEWMTAQQLANQFWIRWTREWLPKLCKRTKWYELAKAVDVGDIVILIDERTPRNTYPKGIVVEVLRSKTDNQVRSAIIQTQTGRYTRPVVKLAVLDVIRKVPENQQPLQGGSVDDGDN